MSFHADRKREHEAAAEQAMRAGRYSKAKFHTAKAAEFGFLLAERSEGKVARRYVEDAYELIEIAEQLAKKKDKVAAKKKKDDAAKPDNPEKPAKADSKSDDGGESVDGEEWLVTEKPTVRLTDIAGMEDVKAKLAEMVLEPLKHPEQAKAFGIKAGGGILLFGPPGNGKTTLAKAVAGELDASFFYATGAEIRSKWHGGSEQRLRKLFKTARAQPVSVLFFDDLDALLPKRGSGGSTVDNRIVAEFLAQIGGFEDSENTLLLLGATNTPWTIDEAVFRTGRFDEKIFVGLPGSVVLKIILEKRLADAPLADDVDFDAVVEALEGYTGSDVVAIASSAKRIAFRRAVSGGADHIAMDDILTAKKTIPSSASAPLMKKYEQFAKRFG